jgi:hypothetical protein
MPSSSAGTQGLGYAKRVGLTTITKTITKVSVIVAVSAGTQGLRWV